MTETNATQAADTPVPDVIPDPSPDAADTSDKSVPKEADDVSEKVQKRISKLTGKWRQAESERDYWRGRAMAQEQNAPPAQPTKSTAAGKKLADFNYDEEAYEAHLEERLRAKSQQDTERERTESAKKARMTSFREREEKFREGVEDYEDVAYAAPISDSVADLLTSMEDGPELVYYLGKNPSVAKRVSAMSESLAAAQLVLLSERLATEREQAKAKPVSKAPPPPPRLDATEPAVEDDPDKMSTKKWLAWREKQLRKK